MPNQISSEGHHQIGIAHVVVGQHLGAERHPVCCIQRSGRQRVMLHVARGAEGAEKLLQQRVQVTAHGAREHVQIGAMLRQVSAELIEGCVPTDGLRTGRSPWLRCAAAASAAGPGCTARSARPDPARNCAPG